MIRYALKCDASHRFEAWFASSDAFDTQAADGHVTCPQCGSSNVTKDVMSPNIASASQASGDVEVATPTTPKETLDLLRKLRKSVEENAEFVGDKFASEARKIHHEEAESRGIYGSASSEEANDLLEEGIPVYPLPDIPEDHN